MLDSLSPSAVVNNFDAVLHYGQMFSEQVPRQEVLDTIEKDPSGEELRKRFPLHYEGFRETHNEIQQFKHVFAENILNTLHPREFGLDLTWRKSQAFALQRIHDVLIQGHQRVTGQIPAGVGKSMILGALARSYLDTVDTFKNQETVSDFDREVWIISSRTNVLRKMAGQTLGDMIPLNTPNDDLEIGDIWGWVDGILVPNEFRVLISNNERFPMKDEWEKDARMTLHAYAGQTEKRYKELPSRGVGLKLDDECHNMTERVTALTRKTHMGAMSVGVSATVKGPRATPFNYYEEVIPKGITVGSPEYETLSYQDKLAFFVSVTESINRKEVKPVRWIQANTDIDISSVREITPGKLDDAAITKLFLRNIDSLKGFMKRVLQDNYPVLDAAGSKPLEQRTHKVYLYSLELVKKMSQYVNDELGLSADFIDGNMTDTEVEEKEQMLESGKIKMLFSCKKAIEGFNVKPIDCVWLLWPLGERSEWMMVHQMGKGMRIDPANPNGDCLIIDPQFVVGKQKLASVLRILASPDNYNGGLIAHGLMRDVEHKILNFLKTGQSLAYIRQQLTTKEWEVAQSIWQKLARDFTITAQSERSNDIQLGAVQNVNLVERHDVKRLIMSDDSKEAIALAREELAKIGIKSAIDIISLNPEIIWNGDIFHDYEDIYHLVLGKPKGNEEYNFVKLAETLGFYFPEDHEVKEIYKDLLYKTFSQPEGLEICGGITKLDGIRVLETKEGAGSGGRTIYRIQVLEKSVLAQMFLHMDQYGIDFSDIKIPGFGNLRNMSDFLYQKHGSSPDVPNVLSTVLFEDKGVVCSLKQPESLISQIKNKLKDFGFEAWFEVMFKDDSDYLSITDKNGDSCLDFLTRFKPILDRHGFDKEVTAQRACYYIAGGSRDTLIKRPRKKEITNAIIELWDSLNVSSKQDAADVNLEQQEQIDVSFWGSLESLYRFIQSELESFRRQGTRKTRSIWPIIRTPDLEEKGVNTNFCIETQIPELYDLSQQLLAHYGASIKAQPRKPIKLSKDMKDIVLDILKNNRVEDRVSLLLKGKDFFCYGGSSEGGIDLSSSSMDFKTFMKTTLGGKYGNKTQLRPYITQRCPELADQLSLSPLDPEKLDQAVISMLGRAGCGDWHSLISLNAQEFAAKKFYYEGAIWQGYELYMLVMQKKQTGKSLYTRDFKSGHLAAFAKRLFRNS